MDPLELVRKSPVSVEEVGRMLNESGTRRMGFPYLIPTGSWERYFDESLEALSDANAFHEAGEGRRKMGGSLIRSGSMGAGKAELRVFPSVVDTDLWDDFTPQQLNEGVELSL